MSNYFKGLMFRFQRFMTGRYGFDEYSKFLIITAIIVYGISFFVLGGLLRPISMAILIYAYFRFFSKKIYKRREELNAYLSVKRKADAKIALRKRMWAERKTYKYFKCPNCKSVWRFPKGKGKIEITCRRCKRKMIKRT